MSCFGWDFPPGVSTLPGESRAEVAYQHAYEDDEGFARAVREQWADYLKPLTVQQLVDVLSLPTDTLSALAQALDCEDVETRKEYAERIAGW